MKLLISAFMCQPNRGSEANNGWNWALEMAKAGHSVWCFTSPNGRKVIESEIVNYPGLPLSFVYVDSPAWVKILHQLSRIPKFFNIYYYINYIAWQRRAAREAKRLDKSVNFDLIHHVTLGSFQLSSDMWRLKKPFVFGPVGGGNFPPQLFKSYFGTGWRMEVTRKWTSNILLHLNPSTSKTARKASLILVTNEDTFKMARRTGSSRIDYFLDAGLPENFFADELPLRQDGGVLKILWVGRLIPRKGLPLVLEALSIIRNHVPFSLTILGDGRMGGMMRTLIDQYGLTDRTDWRGKVSWNEVRNAYRDHHVFMLCSLRDSFGAQFLEAMANGLPIITLNHQGAGDFVPDDAGIKVSVTTPEETVKKLAGAVEYFYTHPELHRTFGLKGLEYAKTQTWQCRAKKMCEIYERLLTSGSLQGNHDQSSL